MNYGESFCFGGRGLLFFHLSDEDDDDDDEDDVNVLAAAIIPIQARGWTGGQLPKSSLWESTKLYEQAVNTSHIPV